jgi:4-hydroxyphenylpyruvate dioxygenase-like putative hemolysin
LSKIEKLHRVIDLPQISQIGVWVHDLDRAVDHYHSIFGVGPFNIHDFQPDKHWYLERPSPIKMRLAKAAWGALELELVQPVEGKSIHRDHLQIHGEGLGHLGFKVAKYETVFDAFVRAGFPCLERAETYYIAYDGWVKAAYFDTRRMGGVVCQIMWRSWEIR